MNLDQARDNLSAANTSLGDAHRNLQWARSVGSRFDVALAEQRWEQAQAAHARAEQVVAELTIADEGGYHP